MTQKLTDNLTVSSNFISQINHYNWQNKTSIKEIRLRAKSCMYKWKIFLAKKQDDLGQKIYVPNFFSSSGKFLIHQLGTLNKVILLYYCVFVSMYLQ